MLLLATLLTFYFLRDGDAFWRRSSLASSRARRSHVEAAGSRAFDVLGGYMIGTGAISIFGAATQFLIMTILGIPLALPLADPRVLRRVHPVHRVADHDRAWRSSSRSRPGRRRTS